MSGAVQPYLADPDVQLYCGDALEVLRTLPDRSMHMCATSPPFYGLRDYGTGTWEGGDEGCDHKAPPQGGPTTGPLVGTGHRERGKDVSYGAECGKCGARRIDRQIGLEESPDEWVARLVEVFREVRRVLRDDGTLWVEIGDSYTSAASGGAGAPAKQHTNAGSLIGRGFVPPRHKPKDLLGQPWLLAFALRADGWYLRSEIIWARPNPMPESVTDRPTKAHSTVFLLSKSPRYFYDQEAVREAFKYDGRNVTHVEKSDGSIQHRNGERWPGLRPQTVRAQELFEQHGLTDAHLTAIRAVGMQDAGKAQVTQTGYGKNNPEMQRLADEAKAALGGYYREFLLPQSGANARSVWTIPTEPTPFAHFATWPQKLVSRMISAGCPENGTVLDCFAGAGTTLLVARKLGRRAVGIELNESYCELAAKRLAQQSLFAVEA